MKRTTKTSQVMRLIASEAPLPEAAEASESDLTSLNPDNPANQTPLPKPKKNRRKAITKNMKLKTEGLAPPGLNPPSKQLYVKPAGERQVVNVISLIVNEQLGAALERFNACACSKCCYEITERLTKEIPPAFVHVADADDAQEVNEKMRELRPEVARALAKIILAGKAVPYHKR